MRAITRIIVVSFFAIGIAGCVVAEEPPRHRVYIYNAPPEPVEVIPAQPAVDMVWARGFYTHDAADWHWHPGYWRHRE